MIETIELIAMVILKGILFIICSILATMHIRLGIYALDQYSVVESVACFITALIVLALIPVVIFVL
jgi:hypothetical protein